MRVRIAILILVAAALIPTAVWYREQQEQREVRAVVDQFVLAATAGDGATVESLLAPGAAVPTTIWLEQNAGMTYAPGQVILNKPVPTPCDAVVIIASALVRDSAGRPHAVMVMLKRVDGRLLVYQGPGKICPDKPDR